MFLSGRGKLGRKSLVANLMLPFAAVGLIGSTLMIYDIAKSSSDASLKLSHQGIEGIVTGITTSIDSVVQANNAIATAEVNAFRLSLGGAPYMTGNRVATGASTIPEMKVGNTTINANLAWLDANIAARYPDPTKAPDPAILIRDGDSMARGVTKLKNADGSTRSGETVKETYAQMALKGEAASETLERKGKMMSIAALPLKNQAGEVIGALTSRVDVEASMAKLKEGLASLKIGETGYVYIVALPAGDQKEMRIVSHPKLSGNISDLPDPKAKEVFNKILEKRSGDLLYDWPDAKGEYRQKLVVFKEIPALHWVVIGGTFVDEFTAAATAQRNRVIGEMVLLMLVCASVLGYSIRKAIQQIRLIQNWIGRVGSGDLTVEILTNTGSRNEVDAIAVSLAGAKDGMANMVNSIKSTSNSLQHATDMSAKSSDLVRRASIDQAEQTASISAATEELSVSIDNTTAQAGIVLNLATETVSVVESGKQVVGNAISQMRTIEHQVADAEIEIKALEARSSDIVKAVTTIKEIADQTNLLALNAAIEAARAGDMGRGFAVVADEVRKLAEQSAKAASTIGQTISSVVESVTKVHDTILCAVSGADAGAKASAQAEVALEQIHAVAKRITEAATEVDLMAREQSASAQSIASSIERMAQTTEETTAAAQSSTDTSLELAAMATQLDKQVSAFSL